MTDAEKLKSPSQPEGEEVQKIRIFGCTYYSGDSDMFEGLLHREFANMDEVAALAEELGASFSRTPVKTVSHPKTGIPVETFHLLNPEGVWAGSFTLVKATDLEYRKLVPDDMELTTLIKD